MNLRKFHHLLALPLVLMTTSPFAQAYTGTPEQQIEAFFTDYASGNIDGAIENYFADAPTALSDEEIALTIALIQQPMAKVEETFGTYIETEDLYTEQITPSTLRIVKMVKHQYSPMLVEFYFYKPDDTWHANRIMFDSLFNLLDKKL